jgi:tRNA G18 (ribose-2'-O)-methylase SpoU
VKARGYFGVGIEAAKTPENVGGLWRSAHAFGAAFMFTIGARYPRRQSPDTTNAWRHIPLHEFDDVAGFAASVPRDCTVIGVETDERLAPRELVPFTHPERAVYLLGAEDRGLSAAVVELCRDLVEIPTAYCLNVATAGSIVLYDRLAKTAGAGRKGAPAS